MELLEAMLTGLVKRPDARFLGISTAAAALDTPLGRLRARALAGRVTRKGAVTDATTSGLRWLEWSLADDKELDDYRAVKACNPASYITAASLREQAARVMPGSFAQFHACRWGTGEGSWLPPGAWQACVGVPHFEPGEAIWVGVDVGGDRSASAVVWVNEQLHVGAAIYHGDAGVLECVDQVRDLAGRYNLREVVFDPWRFGQAAQELERERVTVLAFPQTDVRMVPASVRLHAAIVERRLTLPDDRELASHAANTIARHSRRGWRIDKPNSRANNDGMIALCMALERAEHKPEPVALLGWL
jgi:phage terminase large subunit-like protein